MVPARLHALALALALILSATARPAAAGGNPDVAGFCVEAQQVVAQTRVMPALVVHEEFAAFVKSKASIDPLTIHEYVWYEDEARTRPTMISCKMKSADHLNEALGPGTAAGNGQCQDVNRLTYQRVRDALGAQDLVAVSFDANEGVSNAANPGMTGPDWLKPYVMVTSGADTGLVLHTKGFRVDWLDPRFAAMPGRFRGVQYCHFIAPDYLRRLLTGEARPGLRIGAEIDGLPGAPAPAPGAAPH